MALRTPATTRDSNSPEGRCPGISETTNTSTRVPSRHRKHSAETMLMPCRASTPATVENNRASSRAGNGHLPRARIGHLTRLDHHHARTAAPGWAGAHGLGHGFAQAGHHAHVAQDVRRVVGQKITRGHLVQAAFQLAFQGPAPGLGEQGLAGVLHGAHRRGAGQPPPAQHALDLAVELPDQPGGPARPGPGARAPGVGPGQQHEHVQALLVAHPPGAARHHGLVGQVAAGGRLEEHQVLAHQECHILDARSVPAPAAQDVAGHGLALFGMPAAQALAHVVQERAHEQHALVLNRLEKRSEPPVLPPGWARPGGAPPRGCASPRDARGRCRTAPHPRRAPNSGKNAPRKPHSIIWPRAMAALPEQRMPTNRRAASTEPARCSPTRCRCADTKPRASQCRGRPVRAEQANISMSTMGSSG